MGPKLSDEMEFIEDKFDQLYKIADDIQYDNDLSYDDEYEYDPLGEYEDD